MNTIFIGGSRHLSRLPSEVRKRLDNVVASGHRVIVGDANGADKAVQKHLYEVRYENVTVFCSGSGPRNNLGTWFTRHVKPPTSAKGFHFYAAKDREMAREADFGLMIWDGQSPGTLLNVLRLAIGGKISVLFSVPEKGAFNIKSVEAWKNFIAHRSDALRRDLKERATPDEWRLVESGDQPTFLPAIASAPSALELLDVACDPVISSVPRASALDEVVNSLNDALARSDTTAINETLGQIARDHDMSQFARETGIARENLDRALDSKGDPEFAAVLKVLSSMGLRLEVKLMPGERSQSPLVSPRRRPMPPSS